MYDDEPCPLLTGEEVCGESNKEKGQYWQWKSHARLVLGKTINTLGIL